MYSFVVCIVVLKQCNQEKNKHGSIHGPAPALPQKIKLELVKSRHGASLNPLQSTVWHRYPLCPVSKLGSNKVFASTNNNTRRVGLYTSAVDEKWTQHKTVVIIVSVFFGPHIVITTVLIWTQVFLTLGPKRQWPDSCWTLHRVWHEAPCQPEPDSSQRPQESVSILFPFLPRC